jgi:hypothetical protein
VLQSWTPLHVAAAGGLARIVKELIIAGANIHAKSVDKVGATSFCTRLRRTSILRSYVCPLHSFSQCPHRASLNLSCVLVVPQETPRMVASRQGNTESCKLLGDAESGCTTFEQFEALSMPWYHGRINRAAGEHILSLNGSRDGLFLVRCVFPASACFHLFTSLAPSDPISPFRCELFAALCIHLLPLVGLLSTSFPSLLFLH